MEAARSTGTLPGAANVTAAFDKAASWSVEAGDYPDQKPPWGLIAAGLAAWLYFK